MSVRATGVTIMLAASLLAASDPPVTIDITDYVEMPITGKLDGKGQTDGMLARINSLREEPGGATRFFVNDLNGPLYILDKATTKLSVYLDFNGREGHHGLFRRFAYEVGYANGLNSIQFDPDYRANGKFYTVHIEDPALAGSSVPDNTNLPALNLAGDARTDPGRRRAHRMDRHESVECDVRRHGARADARAAQHADPHAGRLELQPVGAPRRQRVARALHRMRRRRI